MKKIFYFIILIYFVSCTETKDIENIPSQLYPEPKVIDLNTKEGYKINIVTGDSIKPIILENGDTLITGVPIPARGKIIDPNSVAHPKRIEYVPSNVSFIANKNVNKVSEDLLSELIYTDSLTKKTLPKVSSNAIEQINNGFYIVNEIGDTLVTGFPITANYKRSRVIWPEAINVLSPRYKDLASANIRYLDTDQGIPSSDITGILEDSKGNIWFCTVENGVCMYNGVTINHFTENIGFNSNSVISIMEDNQGNIWFGSLGSGVSMYDGDSLTVFTVKDGLTSNYILSVFQDSKDNIWFSTWDKGVTKFDGNSFTHFTTKEGLSSNYVVKIFEDSNDNMWFGTWSTGAIKFDGDSFFYYTKNDGLSSNTVRTFIEDNHGNIWFGTSEGANKFDGKKITYFTEKEGLGNNDIRSIIQDKNDNIWFATFGGGVSYYNQEYLTSFNEENGLSSNIIFSMIEDHNGNIWFGTWGGGLNKYNKIPFTIYQTSIDLENKAVTSLYLDNKGNIWIGTDRDGVKIYNGKTFLSFAENEELFNVTIRAITEDSKGNIWFGTNGNGALMFNGESLIQYTENEGLSNNIVRCMLSDSQGNIWFGTNGGGLCCFNGKYFTHYTSKEGLSNDYVNTILEDKKGNFWIGTWGGGVSSFNGQSFTHFTEKEGLSSNIIYSISVDYLGNLWFGSNKGLEKFNGDSLVHFTREVGLINNIINSIIEDNNHKIWVGTSNGLSIIENKKENQKTKIVSFEKKDGLIGVDFLMNSVCTDNDKLWWGSSKGLTSFDLDSYDFPKNPPTIYLRQIDINDQFIDYHNLEDSSINDIEFDAVKRFENYPLNIELPYNKNHLTFHFIAIDWSAPHKIQYSYLLSGLEHNWSSPSSETKADYRNIPFGSYTFKVRAIGASGEWSEPFEYTFTIHPPWWHTWWAYTLYVLIAIQLIWLLIRMQTKRLKQRQKELETEVDNATKEIRSQKQDIENTLEIVETQKEQVEEAHKEIKDSINYAERIQRSFLATTDLLNENLGEYFVFFQPKDVVSGDFYWAGKLSNGNFAMVNADSTGHGVPGAIMSILNISSIEKAIDKDLTEPADIFNDTRKTIIERLKKDGSEHGGKDGMDASIISFDFRNLIMTYCAAQNPIWIIRNGEVIQIKPEKMPVGKHDKDNIPFVGGEFKLQKSDQVYTITDGFQDQFGGEKGKKFMVKRMREYILSISNLPMSEQHKKIKEVFENWKGDLEQVDDVCVIGIKID